MGGAAHQQGGPNGPFCGPGRILVGPSGGACRGDKAAALCLFLGAYMTVSAWATCGPLFAPGVTGGREVANHRALLFGAAISYAIPTESTTD